MELEVQYNNLSNLPDEIVKLKPTRGSDFGYNKLDTNNLSDSIIAWLDEYDPDWKETQQITPIINNGNTNFALKSLSLNIKNSSILFHLPAGGDVKLQIYNMKGRLLSTLVDTYKQAGSYTVKWDSNGFSAGIYYIRLTSGNNSQIRKIALLKP